MPYTTLSPADRRALTLRALRGENRRRLSEEYGVGESYIYKLLDLATADPDAALAEAEAELAFRREVAILAQPAQPTKEAR